MSQPIDARDVTVIVLNHNGRQWLGPCPDALRSQDARGFEVIVVDNASTDDSVVLVGNNHPEVRIVALSANLGFAAGNNAGAREARGRMLAFLNNDTVVQPGWLEALRRPFNENASIGLTTSRIVFLDDPDVIDSAGDGYLRAGGGFKRRHGQPATRAAESGEVFGACGAAFMVRREVFEDLGGFDEDFFMVYEDVDLSYRARLRGHRVWYAADAIVHHAGSASLGTISARAVFLGQRNLEWTYLKNTPWPLLLRSAPAHAAYVLASGIGYAANGRFRDWLKGKGAAIAGLPAVIGKRREIQRRPNVPASELWARMDRDWIGVKRAEKTFDLPRAGRINGQ